MLKITLNTLKASFWAFLRFKTVRLYDLPYDNPVFIKSKNKLMLSKLINNQISLIFTKIRTYKYFFD